MAFELGIDRLLKEKKLISGLKGKKVALVAHPASVDSRIRHSLDLLSELNGIKLVSAFGPQHGMRGEKQYNMIETEDYYDPYLKIPVFSLYGKVRRPTSAMMNTFDVVLFDLQDVGTRIYTFLTTLLYMMEACSKCGKEIWVLDRPNPAGRSIEGHKLRPGFESFVGAGPLPIRHSLTLGEAALWFQKHFSLDVNLKVIAMKGYNPTKAPEFGWPRLSWVNPSPNAATPAMARCFAGTVLIEGTHLSEGRGTTRPLEVIGAPDINIQIILKEMEKIGSSWMKGCVIRPCYFQPTFYKYKDSMCEGIQIHVDQLTYDPKLFKPFRLVMLFLKALHKIYPDYKIFRNFEYEYEKDRLAFDLITGGTIAREWIEDSRAKPDDLDKVLRADEKAWRSEIKPHLLYHHD
ncbi:MAG: hypothetical protein A4S09_03075 [Proteobacteria bacterium SG_bin7]|nr:MAG: hypothetical protein A4S09_03075 [Proteobacteria bacterium SG_bin7]